MELQGLPREVFLLIGEFLGLPDFLALCSSCRQFQADVADYWNRKGVLEKAVQSGRHDLVARLLQNPRGGRMDQKILVAPNRAFNLLEFACWAGDLETVRVLLQDPRTCPSANCSRSLRLAVRQGHLEIVRLILLLDKDKEIDAGAKLDYAVRRSCRWGHLEILHLLLSRIDVDPSARDNEAIIEAAMNGHVEITRTLLRHPKVDPAARYNTAIGLASKWGETEIVQLLLADPRVDPSDDGNWALRQASAKGHVDIVRLLISHPKVDDYGFEALKSAIENRHLPCIDCLLSQPGMSFNIINRE